MAVLFNIAFEAWTDDTWPGIGPMGNPLPGGAPDTQAQSWARYGHTSGIWRLIDVLERSQVRATVFASACLAEIAPDTLRAVVRHGHEVAAHGYSQNILPALLAPGEERDEVLRCIDLLTSVTGAPPAGWLSPRGTPSPHTAELAAEQGMTWFGDVFDQDNPYMIETRHGHIVGIPLKMAVNDLPHYMRYGNPPRDFIQTFKDTFAAMYKADGDGVFLDVTVHAHVFGRPEGAWTIEAIARQVAEYPDVWIPTRRELAEWAREVLVTTD